MADTTHEDDDFHEVRTEFATRYPLVPENVVTDAICFAKAGGKLNVNIEKIRGFAANLLLSKKGQSGEDKVRQYFPEEAEILISRNVEMSKILY